MPLHAIAIVAIMLTDQKGILTSIAQSSAPHAFLFDRIQKRSTVKTMSKGRGIKAAKAIEYEVGAIVVEGGVYPRTDVYE
jgi:hypothetical protein